MVVATACPTVSFTNGSRFRSLLSSTGMASCWSLITGSEPWFEARVVNMKEDKSEGDRMGGWSVPDVDRLNKVWRRRTPPGAFGFCLQAALSNVQTSSCVSIAHVHHFSGERRDGYIVCDIHRRLDQNVLLCIFSRISVNIWFR